MNKVTLNLANPQTAKPLIEALEKLEIYFKVELSKDKSNLFTSTDLFGLPSSLNSIQITVNENDFIENKMLFSEFGFNFSSNDKNLTELEHSNKKVEQIYFPKKPKVSKPFILFGFKINPHFRTLFILVCLICTYYIGPSSIPRNILIFFFSVLFLDWAYDKLKNRKA